MHHKGKPRLEYLDDGRLSFDCPGCGLMHAMHVDHSNTQTNWTWNDDMVNPTFSPSLMVRWTFGDNRQKKICHSFIINGNVEFLNDCTHKHAGETLPLNPVGD